MTMTINPAILYNLTASDKNGTLPYKGSINANIAYVNNLSTPIRGGLAAIVGGYDDATTSGYAQLRYLAKNYSNGLPDGSEYNDAKTVLTVTNEFENSPLNLADYDSTFTTVNAAARTTGLKIAGNSGSDTLTGGNGTDAFIYSAGNDVITDYTVGEKISPGAAITNASISGNDAVLTLGSDTLTIKNGKSKTLSLITATGKELSAVISSTLTLEAADASARTAAIQISGSTASNVVEHGANTVWLLFKSNCAETFKPVERLGGAFLLFVNFLKVAARFFVV